MFNMNHFWIRCNDINYSSISPVNFNFDNYTHVVIKVNDSGFGENVLFEFYIVMVEKLHKGLSYIIGIYHLCICASKKIVEKWTQPLKQNKMWNTEEAINVS